jgi:peptide/nickel transport system substrate-binding protein
VAGSTDGKTVTVVFNTPFAEWQGLFTNLLPAHYVQRQPGGWNRGLAKHPERIPSGGPFQIAEFTPGETVTLARNDRYWGPKAHLDAIQFRLVPDSDAQVAALRNREADLIRPQSTTDLINIVKRLPGVQSQVRTSLGFEHLTFNLKHPALAELAVRRAIATAIDTRQLVDRLLVPVNPDARPLGNRDLARWPAAPPGSHRRVRQRQHPGGQAAIGAGSQVAVGGVAGDRRGLHRS